MTQKCNTDKIEEIRANLDRYEEIADRDSARTFQPYITNLDYRNLIKNIRIILTEYDRLRGELRLAWNAHCGVQEHLQKALVGEKPKGGNEDG